MLIATYPILHNSRQYKVGDELPTNNSNMMQAWLEAGTAIWRDTANSTNAPVEVAPEQQKSEDGPSPKREKLIRGKTNK